MNKLLTFFIIIILITGSVQITEANVLLYNLKKDKLNFGKIITEKKENNGILEIKSVQTIKAKLFFVEQVFNEEITMKIDLNSGTRSIRLISNSPVKNRTAEVVIYKNKAYIKEINIDGSIKETKLEDKENLYFEMDYFVLNRDLNIRSGDEFEFKTVDIESLSIKTNHIKVLKKLSTGKRWGEYVFEVKRHMYESVETYDFDFNVISIEVQNPHIIIELADNKTEEIHSFEIKDGDLMEYKIKLSEFDPEKIKSAVFEISFKGDDILNLVLSDERQKILKEEIIDELNKYEIEISHVSTLKDLEIDYSKIDSTEVKEYLEETSLVRKNSDLLKPILKILENETRLDKIIEKTVEYIQSEIVSDIIPQTLNSDEILKLKKGMCMHYGVVFAAVMRRLGIPCRCVMGEIYNFDRFLPHMYNEIYNGEKWITIDSTKSGLRNITSNPLLLKLGHGKDLMDLGSIKGRLINNLKIENVIINKK